MKGRRKGLLPSQRLGWVLTGQSAHARVLIQPHQQLLACCHCTHCKRTAVPTVVCEPSGGPTLQHFPNARCLLILLRAVGRGRTCPRCARWLPTHWTATASPFDPGGRARPHLPKARPLVPARGGRARLHLPKVQPCVIPLACSGRPGATALAQSVSGVEPVTTPSVDRPLRPCPQLPFGEVSCSMPTRSRQSAAAALAQVVCAAAASSSSVSA